MRPARLVSGLALLLIGSAAAQAASVPYEATIQVPEVEVRSGPSAGSEFYPTSKLHRGDVVIVVKEEIGWLAIKPPRGSFSWVNSHLLQPSTDWRTAMVLANDVEVRIGSELTDKEPTVHQVKLQRGAQVFIRDFNKAYNEKGGWLPIYPPEQEVRYIPADAVRASPEVQTVQASPVAPSPAAAPVAVSNNPTFNDLWLRAEQAEARSPAEAIELYRQLAHQATNDHDLQMRCYNRIHFLREGNRGSVPPGYQPGHPSTASYPNHTTGTRLIPSPSMAPYPPAYVQPTYTRPTSQYTYYRETSRPAAAPIPATNYANYPAPVPSTAQWSQPGWLRRTSIFLDGTRPYALVGSDGKVLMYMTPQPGVSLDSYVERHVQLWGPLSYHNGMRTYFMNVQQVRPLQ